MIGDNSKGLSPLNSICLRQTVIFPVNFLVSFALVSPMLAPAPETKTKQTFTSYSAVPGQYALGIDLESIKLVEDQNNLKVLMDIEIVMDKPVKYFDSVELVKSYQNSIAVNCSNDRLVVIVGRAFDLNNSQIYSSTSPQIVENPHEEFSPTTQIMKFVCDVIGTRPKNSLKKNITT